MPKQEWVIAPIDRGAPLVATGARWIASALAIGAGFALALQGSLWFMHSERTLASFAGALATAVALEAALVFTLLRAEEARVARELRTARTGTAALRGMVASRRQQLPFLARLLSTKVGTAAVLLADGDRAGALDVLATGSLLMRGGRLDRLRAGVEADAERAAGTAEALEHCIEQLGAIRAEGGVGNREADLYLLHVLVKAILERGEVEVALDLVDALGRSKDEEERLYLVWLRAWFDLDEGADDGDRGDDRAGEGGKAPPPPLPVTEGEVRLAALLARSHGAEKLVEKLEKRAAAIARVEPQG
jgi:ketosteroid isomerase-like protein